MLIHVVLGRAVLVREVGFHRTYPLIVQVLLAVPLILELILLLLTIEIRILIIRLGHSVETIPLSVTLRNYSPVSENHLLLSIRYRRVLHPRLNPNLFLVSGINVVEVGDSSLLHLLDLLLI